MRMSVKKSVITSESYPSTQLFQEASEGADLVNGSANLVTSECDPSNQSHRGVVPSK